MTEALDVSPRPEAQPLPWDELTKDQQAAAHRACTLLKKLAELSWTKPGERQGVEHFLPPIDRERQNHVILLDGGRGSGKTALLITLIDAWSWSVRRADTKAFAPPPEFKDLLASKGPIVPVGLVDLQPLPASANLLIHLVGQFQRLIEAIERDGAGGSAPRREQAPWHDEDEAEKKSRTRWRDFLRAAASGWDASLERRRANLDPEAYALEMEEAGRRRLDVVTSFRELVDALVEEYKIFQRTSDNPLFLVAIDDADMNPGRSLELLDLLRTLWHPRVAFVLTGDTALFLEVLRAHAFRELRKPLRELQVPNKTWTQMFNGSEQPRRLAQDIYDKVIPPEQRCEIGDLSLKERFEKLKRGLEKIPASGTALRVSTLAEYFELQPQAQAILPERLRLSRDLEQALERRAASLNARRQDAREQGQQQAATQILLERCHDKVEAPVSSAWGDLSNEERISLLSASIPELTWLPATEQTVRLATKGRIAFSFQYGFRVRALLSNGVFLPPSEVARWIVTLDLSRQLGRAGLGLRGFVVRTEVRLTTNDWYRFAWPLPHWNTFLDYASFTYCWNEVTGLSGIDPSTAAENLASNPRQTAQKFLMTVIEFGQLRMAWARRGSRDALWRDALKSMADTLRQRAVPSWEQLAEQVAHLATAETQRSERSHPEKQWALVRAGLLAAPESGLMHADANDWLRALKASLASAWEREVVPALTGQRRARVRFNFSSLAADSTSNDMADVLLHEIDRLFPEHAWSREVRVLRGGLANEFFSTLSTTYVNQVSLRGNIATMQSYLIAGRRAALEERSSATLKERWNEAILPFRGSQGVAPLIVTALWKEASDLGEAPGLVLSKSSLDVKSMSRIYESLGDAPWDWLTSGDTRSAGPKVRVRPAIFGWREPQFRNSLSSVLYELAWDVIVDVDDSSAQSPPTLGWWEAGGGQRDNDEQPLYFWPAVEWPSFIDYELLAEAWNTVYPIALRAVDIAPEDEGIGNDLAYWYISAVKRLAETRSIDPSWSSGVSLERWNDLIGTLSSTDYQAGFRGNRWAAYVAWCRALPLFAAPEAGLSDAVAEAILSPGKIPDERRKELYKLRRDRMHHRKPRQRPIEPELKRIDAKHPEHPWVKLIEER